MIIKETFKDHDVIFEILNNLFESKAIIKLERFNDPLDN